MAKRYGHQSLVMAVAEVTYGTAVTTPTEKYSMMFNWDLGTQPIPTNFKTQKLDPVVCTQQEGRIAPTVTLSGDYVEELELIIGKLFMDSSSPYVFPQSDPGTTQSLTLYRAFPTEGVVNDAGDGFQGTGYRPTKLVITRDGDKITTTIDLIGQDGDEEVDLSGLVLTTITDTSSPCHTLMPFHSAVFSVLDGGVTKINNFTLTIEVEYNDEDSQFQNSQTRQNVVAIGAKATLEAEYVYDTTADALAYDNIYSQTPKAVSVALTDGAATHTYALKGHYAKWTLPDIDKGLYLGNFIFEAHGDASNVGITMTVS